MAERNDSPEARAHALITRILGLVQECRAILPELEAPAAETPGAQAERHLYIALLGVLADGLVRTVDEALTMLRHASKPLGPMGTEWLDAQERELSPPDAGDPSVRQRLLTVR